DLSALPSHQRSELLRMVPQRETKAADTFPPERSGHCAELFETAGRLGHLFVQVIYGVDGQGDAPAAVDRTYGAKHGALTASFGEKTTQFLKCLTHVHAGHSCRNRCAVVR